MRKLSIVLLLLFSVSLFAMENNLLLKGKRHLQLRQWNDKKKSALFAPIEAVIDETYIEVQFFKSQDSPVTFQIKDKQGNVIFQDITLPNQKEIYKIELDNLEGGQYELFYIEEDTVFRGEFKIDQ